MHLDQAKKALFACLALLWLAAGGAHAASDTRAYWQDTQARSLASEAPQPAAYRALQLDVDGLKAALSVPGATLSLPHPAGGFAEFTLTDSGVMPAELAARYPDIRSYVGVDGSGNRARVDISPLGINVMVFERSSGHGIWVVRPDVLGAGSGYLSFYRKELAVPHDMFSCGVHSDIDPSGQNLVDPEPNTQTGIVRRTYRAAVAANRQYTNAVGGGTVAGGLAAVVVAMNRVNEVYENDFSVHMTLVPNNDQIIYTDANPGPYSNSSSAINQNQTNLDSVIGSANYDIGHVFTTGSGGVAGLGVVCRNGQKAAGTTGLSNPIGDVFYIDFVAHEMGHQFGGNHTFNSTTNSCGGNNRAASAAYEPGSGSTIQAYAGICGTQNLQPNSDAYFHAESLREMGNYISTGAGANCAATAANPNPPPVVTTHPGRTIPANTPFELTGAATGGSGLTYTWEQYDRGPANNNFNVDPGTGPIIRSLMPTASPNRTVPRIDQLLAGTNLRGEILPTTSRTLTFRLTARDNATGGGTTESADVVHTVVNTAGPFKVTGPAGGSTWNYLDGAGTASVSWDVANTNVAPVACANVDVKLSHDSGLTYPVVVATGLPNTGSATVPVPNQITTQARIRVQCADNIFFNVSPGDFSIAGGSELLFADGFDGQGGTVAPTLAKAFTPDSVAEGATSTLTITLANANATPATLSAALTDSFPSGLVVAATPTATTTCGGTLSAVAGAGSVSLGSGAVIPATGSCLVQVNVTAAVAGSYPNTLAVGALQTDLGANLVAATATLTVTEESSACPAQLIQDTSFEASTGDGGSNPFWNSTTTQGDSTFWSASSGGATVRTGNWAVWFGGYGTVTTETHEFSQSVTIPNAGGATLKYWRNIARTGTNTNTVTFSVDGTVLRTENLVTLGVSGWTEQSLDLSTYADGQPHLIKVSYTHSGGGQDANYFLDDITLDCSP